MVAKKKAAQIDKTPRKTPMSAEAFRTEASELRALGETLRKIADEVAKQPGGVVAVDGQAMLAYAKKYVKRFILNAQRGLT